MASLGAGSALDVDDSHYRKRTRYPRESRYRVRLYRGVRRGGKVKGGYSQDLFKFKHTLVPYTLSIPAASSGDNVLIYHLSDVPQVSDYQAMFDCGRLRKVEARIMTYWTAALGSALTPFGEVIMANDADTNLMMTDTVLLAHAGSKTYLNPDAFHPIRWKYFVPRKAIQDTTTGGLKQPGDTWLDSDLAATTEYGYTHCYLRNLSSEGTMYVRIHLTYYTEWKNRR